MRASDRSGTQRSKSSSRALRRSRARSVPGNLLPEPGRSDLSYFEITLSDNGIGFPQHHAESIFKAFTRLHTKDKFEGTGIGLSLCKNIVEKHGGFIEAIGEEGAGATFRIFLPEVLIVARPKFQ